jgi:serine/threonine protein kinase
MQGEAVLTFFPRTRSNTPGAFVINAGAEPSPGYRLRRARGRGGFAEVWEADTTTGPVALKFMASANAATTAREIRALQSLQAMDHPYLVRNHGVWSVPGYIVIDMELAEATLLDLMLVYQNDLGQDIDPPQLLLYLWQVANGLDFLNTRQHHRDGRRVGFQHGDIKPNNILLFGDVAKLTDYGLATATYGPTTPCPRQGTREYAAPEVFQGYLSETSDQFSLAVTYHLLRTGAFPFPPPPSELPKMYTRPAPDLSAMPQPEAAVLSRALSPVPQDRFPSCQDFMRAMLRAHGLKVEKNDRDEWKVRKDSSPELPGSKLIRSGPVNGSRPGLSRPG